MSSFNLSVCICTRNRPSDLKNALNSLYLSTKQVFEVIVSDDSTNNETMNLVKSFPNVKYVKGPKKGLGSNRNNALKYVNGTHVLFIDDDVVLGEKFVETIFSNILQFNEKGKQIFTGIENNRGHLVIPNDTNFLGYQNVRYNDFSNLRTIVINSTIFPKNLFNYVSFDEQLIYGYDEVDIAKNAIKLGYKIIICKDAVNYHFPSIENRDYYSPFKEASRIYVTYKHYYYLEKKYLYAFAFLIVSRMHNLYHLIRKEGINGVISFIRTLNLTRNYIRNFKKKVLVNN
ncbi:glycosyltransferase family 2 protein [Neobacillus cucumis]|uniref:Glycosyltransferase family 2 protein n=1 Tax=Neobacillus cucumis TaxID=1740721 RepID=A0A2N5H7L3_9BACI|nr:glycosyltransferase [Neobacillus cucumis]PLS01512.1 glycosyltransferase family 2 protein [Neobacillus cucumis]